MVAQGDLMQPIDPQVELLDGKLRFSWQNAPDLEYANKRDQVMMLAYFPDTKTLRRDIFGCMRTAGEDFLEIDDKYQNAKMEVYMALYPVTGKLHQIVFIWGGSKGNLYFLAYAEFSCNRF